VVEEAEQLLLVKASLDLLVLLGRRGQLVFRESLDLKASQD
jgi:hypothetical protein